MEYLTWLKKKDNKIKKVNKDEFVNEIAESLDSNVHGDVASRTEIATRIYDNYTQKSTPDWREQGDTNLKGIFEKALGRKSTKKNDNYSH